MKRVLEIKRIECEAPVSSVVGECIAEAITLAGDHGCTVTFEFNGQEFELDAQSDGRTAENEYMRRCQDVPPITGKKGHRR